MRLVAARLPAAMGKDTFITEGTLAEVVALADLLAVFIMGFSIGGLGLVLLALPGTGGPSLDMMLDLSRKDWPFLVMAQTYMSSLMVSHRREVS